MKFFNHFFKIVLIAFGAIILLISFLATYNQIALKQEANQIVPNGLIVPLGDYNLHVYTEGENEKSPTLVFLSGSGTVAPTYDFKVLYSLLSDEYRIAVVEKAGYGYSDIVAVRRDVESMVNEVRTALSGAGIENPYLLIPHSMSGLEAIYWAQNYPDEVAGIIGIDMAVPEAYDDFNFEGVRNTIETGALLKKLGFLRIPGIYPLNEATLTETEIQQQKLLMGRNVLNPDMIAEMNEVYDNAQTVKAGGAIACPLLLFTSDGKETGEAWITEQKKFAAENHAEIISFDYGHYLHYYKSKEMAEQIKRFAKK